MAGIARAGGAAPAGCVEQKPGALLPPAACHRGSRPTSPCQQWQAPSWACQQTTDALPWLQLTHINNTGFAGVADNELAGWLGAAARRQAGRTDRSAACSSRGPGVRDTDVIEVPADRCIGGIFTQCWTDGYSGNAYIVSAPRCLPHQLQRQLRVRPNARSAGAAAACMLRRVRTSMALIIILPTTCTQRPRPAKTRSEACAHSRWQALWCVGSSGSSGGPASWSWRAASILLPASTTHPDGLLHPGPPCGNGRQAADSRLRTLPTLLLTCVVPHALQAESGPAHLEPVNRQRAMHMARRAERPAMVMDARCPQRSAALDASQNRCSNACK